MPTFPQGVFAGSLIRSGVLSSRRHKKFCGVSIGSNHCHHKTFCEGIIRFGLCVTRDCSQLYLEVVTISLLRMLYFPTVAKNVLSFLMKEACSGDSDVELTQTSREGHVAF